MFRNIIMHGRTQQISGSKLTRLLWFALMFATCIVFIIFYFKQYAMPLGVTTILLIFELAVYVIIFFDREKSRRVSLEFAQFKYENVYDYPKRDEIDPSVPEPKPETEDSTLYE